MIVLTEEKMKCIKCGVKIPPKRLKILPNTKTCVKCSTTGAYVGRPVQYGKGDHTYVELDIMTPEQAKKLEKLIQQEKEKKTSPKKSKEK